MIRELLFYKSYFLDFYFKQNQKTQVKIDFVLDLIRNIDRIPVKFLKMLRELMEYMKSGLNRLEIYFEFCVFLIPTDLWFY